MYFDRTYTDYIPDITERYPEGFGGADMCSPRDREYEAWQAFVRDYERTEGKDLQEGV